MLAAALLLIAPAELSPLDWLIDRCWRGDVAPGAADTHCFTRAPDGAVIDRHAVVKDGATIYSGETRYHWDGAARAIRFTYRNAGGPVASGQVRAVPDGLDYGTMQLKRADGRSVTVSSRWVRVGTDAYDMIDRAPDAPDFDRRTRFTRVDPSRRDEPGDR